MSNQSQSWAGLPDFHKRQAARDMLAGRVWSYYGNKVEHPGEVELRRWLANVTTDAKQEPPAPTREAGRISGTSRTSARKRLVGNPIAPAPAPRLTNRQKRTAVDEALVQAPALSDRAIAGQLGVSHTYVANRRHAISAA